MKNLKRSVELAAKSRVALAVWGRHGVGKTAVIEGLRDDGFYVKTIILSQSDPLTLGGYPGREKLSAKDTETGQAEFVTTFAVPTWILDLRAAADRGEQPILFLDEFNRADKYAHAAAMRLVNEREICGHKLPSNTCFVAAMNPDVDTDDVLPLTDPMIDRFAHIAVHSSPKMWLEWADTKLDPSDKSATAPRNVNRLVTGFIKGNHNRLNGFSMNTYFERDVLNRIKPTERSNDAISRLITALADENGGNFDKSQVVGNGSAAAYNIITGLGGREYASEFVTFLADDYNKPFTTKEILSGKDAVVERVIEIKEGGECQVLIESLFTARPEIAEKIKDPAKVGKKLDGFWLFLQACPADVQQAFWDEKTDAVVTKFWLKVLAEDSTPQIILDCLNQ